MASTDLTPNLTGIAQGPARAEADGVSMVAQDIAKVIAADRYLAAKAARGRRWRGLMMAKILPAGCFPDSQGTARGGVNGNFDSPGGF